MSAPAWSRVKLKPASPERSQQDEYSCEAAQSRLDNASVRCRPASLKIKQDRMGHDNDLSILFGDALGTADAYCDHSGILAADHNA
jgi:hypothetical protein